ncbi:MAG: 3-isopropylmalate dehydratase [candidate division KSB1 bacterium]|nr:3-isopropylmalate dehydratase [candidate division KSB1 bacterium]
MEEQRLLEGLVFVVGDNVDTDQIIPAQYLVYSLTDPEESKNYGRYALSGLPSEWGRFVEEGQWQSRYSIVVAGRNFGCGSSREHAPAALQIAGVKAVVAQSYARIFFRNAVDGGFLLPLETDAPLHQVLRTGEKVQIDLSSGLLRRVEDGSVYHLKPIGDVEAIVRAGGLFGYARQLGMIRSNAQVRT